MVLVFFLIAKENNWYSLSLFKKLYFCVRKHNVLSRNLIA